MLTSRRQVTTDSALNIVESFVSDAADSKFPKIGRGNPWLLAAEVTLDIAVLVIGIAGPEGCAAQFPCDGVAQYSAGMTGAQIKAAFNNLFQNDKVKVCGSSYLSNGCHVTVNGCAGCQDRGAVLFAA